MLKAIIFDFDGVIIDTESAEFASWQELYASHDLVLELEVWSKVIGVGNGVYDMYAELAQRVGRTPDIDALRTTRRSRNAELVEVLTVLPGVVGWLEDARALGLKTAVASSSSVDWVDGHLRRLDLRRYFDAVLCADHVARTKPDPELYIAACDALGVTPAEAVAIEDSPNGIKAAKAAGIYCIAVPNELTAQLDLSQADVRIASLAELTLGDFVAGNFGHA